MPSPTYLSASPSSLAITGIDSTETFTVTDSNPTAYTGFYSASSESTAIATVSAGPGYNGFTVTSAGAGTTSIDVSTSDGGFLKVPVTVNNSGTVVNVKGHK